MHCFLTSALLLPAEPTSLCFLFMKMCCHIFRSPKDSKSLESSCQAWGYISQPSLPTHLCLNGLNDWFSLKKCEHESSVKTQVIKKQRSLPPSLFHHLPGAERKMCGCREGPGPWEIMYIDHTACPLSGGQLLQWWCQMHENWPLTPPQPLPDFCPSMRSLFPIFLLFLPRLLKA